MHMQQPMSLLISVSHSWATLYRCGFLFLTPHSWAALWSRHPVLSYVRLLNPQHPISSASGNCTAHVSEQLGKQHDVWIYLQHAWEPACPSFKARQLCQLTHRSRWQALVPPCFGHTLICARNTLVWMPGMVTEIYRNHRKFPSPCATMITLMKQLVQSGTLGTWCDGKKGRGWANGQACQTLHTFSYHRSHSL